MSKRDRAKSPPTHAHRRQIQISVVLPTSVKLIVGTDDEDPDEHSDWEILEVIRTSCEATQRLVSESMHDADFEALAAAAFNAEDLP